MQSRMMSLTELISSRSVSCAPVIEARTRSEWLTTASRSWPRPSTSDADARLVLGVGAFQLVDLGVDERLQLDGARQRAFDAFAHRRDLAAHRLADHHDAVLARSLPARRGGRQPRSSTGRRCACPARGAP